jgi:hypothetical protein
VALRPGSAEASKGAGVKRLILTTEGSGAGNINGAGLADLAIALQPRLVWRPPLSQIQLSGYFAARTTQTEKLHWQYCTPARRIERAGGKDLGLVDFCAKYDQIELWIDPDPNAQLTLVWFLDFLRGHEQLAKSMTLVQADVRIGGLEPNELANRKWPRANVTGAHLEAANVAWKAWREPTPQAWFDLSKLDSIPLPGLEWAVTELLGELPGRTTGLSATECWMLERIAQGNASPADIFWGIAQRGQRAGFYYWEIGELLAGLAYCPAPAISGLTEATFTLEMHDDRERYRRYNESQLSLTTLGNAILTGTGDFSRHNPIHRWWGGTEITNDRLWRWDATSKSLIAP